MNKTILMKQFLRGARIFGALLAVIFLTPPADAQPPQRQVQNRWLFVFDTAKDMKLRVEAVQKSLNLMLATSMNGQLHAGDSLGVWTFGQNLHTGKYPLLNWNPDQAAAIASNLVKFVGGQAYVKSTHLESLEPLLDKVVQDSERLTVLVFCDGDGKMAGTPFDASINQALREKSAAQKKAGEPLVIVLRSQRGEFTGCTLTLPPQPLSLPEFPPLPQPPPAPKVESAPPPAPVVMGQPLIIIGKNPSNSVPSKPNNARVPYQP
jgi:hypothetical protein